ncbi:MAG: ribosome silencing factor [Kiritimatiellaceae bacterium]|nr:ribosome silencing factor [Kiritimatiellaceae bacterium]|tara:strand:+ start:599 stop:943 length:345 start_codon:yes stop_codon:yes gene_type:complete
MIEETLINNISSYLDDKKALNIQILDLKKVSTVSDYFIIATGANRPHLKALFEGLQLKLKEEGLTDFDRTGIPDSGWLILDIQGVMVHIFEEEIREYYDLESLWKDALVTRVEE